MVTRDGGVARCTPERLFRLVAAVEEWPAHLPHYRWVRLTDRASDGGGIVEMAAWRPVPPVHVGWPTWWRSEMAVDARAMTVRFRHIGGITTGMDVEWALLPHAEGTEVRLLHVWDGPRWPLIGVIAATLVIGPVFVHGIAARTVAGLIRAAERGA